MTRNTRARHVRFLRSGWLLLLVPFLLAGCDGRQSVLVDGGADARILTDLFWVMLTGAVVLWIGMNGLFYWATRRSPAPHSQRMANWLVILGGILFPTLTLGALLVYGLTLMPDLRATGDGPVIRVTGEQWWWRVDYTRDDGSIVTTANEIRLPAGVRSTFLLDSKKVIHSFWVPSLGGKMDMFPGRVTEMTLGPERPGIYRGQCAEFCGESHAWMAFEAEVMAPEAFEAWLDAEAAPAVAPTSAEAGRGAALFLSQGCGACHAVRGTPATGRVGPDLTHVGSRHSLAAGRLGTSVEDFAKWVANPGAWKPGAEMPAYDHLTDAQIGAIAAYLEGLE
ncbi:cytochrome c oxidase subunit II [Limimaricola hongkongensis]|uniref:Cytochrome c oxidase polypeptide II n=1 Tax=Limimaricola hongkongensis DSM 17492 TaxID=1122180 RepID=A0A017HFA8_9RHOB|nr:c-type cytochrome [Limimaricola hongkongensis]EYD72474.1 Cytochrome c oxidase polypeptide II [Limimaricola hongkongensis DSM 17492]